MSLEGWLSQRPHSHSPPPDVWGICECAEPTDQHRSYLVECMIKHRTSVPVARRLYRALGWPAARRRLVPSTSEVAKGDFGEMLATEVLVHFAGLEIPINKVRYQMHAGSTQVGADILAFDTADDRVVAIHFAEVKFRSTRDLDACVGAHDQLLRWHDQEYSDIIWFVAERLAELLHPLAEPFLRYLESPTTRDDSFHILVVCEQETWNDEALKRLPEPPAQISPLQVRVVGIADLSELVSTTYAALSEFLQSDA